MFQTLTVERIAASLQATGKKDALQELAVRMHGACPSCGSAEDIFAVLSEREQIGSTAFGDGVAIPHGKMEKLEKIEIFFGRSIRGIPFAAVDNKPVHLFFILLAPTESAGPYLKTLAMMARFLKSSHVRSQLLHAETSEEIAQIFAAAREFR
ncbi:MAG: PTS sugar transporter subunit IIA [Pseudomonadota bacterium]